MLQSFLSLDRRAADCGGSLKSDDTARRAGLGALVRAIFAPSPRTRLRADPLDPLSDHLLQDIGLSRADVQALTL